MQEPVQRDEMQPGPVLAVGVIWAMAEKPPTW